MGGFFETLPHREFVGQSDEVIRERERDTRAPATATPTRFSTA